MSPLLFALLDAMEMRGWAGEYAMYRGWRRNARMHCDRMGFEIAHKQMLMCRVHAVGAWRSLWGVL